MRAQDEAYKAREEALSAQRSNTVYQEAVALQNIGDSKSAIEKYEEALLIYKQAHDFVSQAVTHTAIRFVYQRLGDKERAFEYYNEALAIYRTVGDKGREKEVLRLIDLLKQPNR